MIKQQLFHPLIMGLAKKLYNFLELGKLIILISKKLKFTSKAVLEQEKSGGQPLFLSKKLQKVYPMIFLSSST